MHSGGVSYNYINLPIIVLFNQGGRHSRRFKPLVCIATCLCLLTSLTPSQHPSRAATFILSQGLPCTRAEGCVGIADSQVFAPGDASR